MIANSFILIVDEDKNVHSSLKRMLSREGFNVVVASNYVDAVDIFQTHPVAVVASDYLMLDMSKLNILEYSKSNYPQTVRIMLSAYIAKKQVTKLDDQGIVEEFIEKPWDDVSLASRIRESFAVYKKRCFGRKELESID